MAQITVTDATGTPTTPSAGTTTIYTLAGVLYVINPSGIPSALLLTSVLTADGDLLYRNGASAVTRLPVGTPGQALIATTVGLDVLPVWTALADATLPSALAGVANAGSGTLYARINHVHVFPTASDVGAVAIATFTADGDMVYRDGNSTVVPLPIGAPGQSLVATTVGPDTLPVWTTPAKLTPSTANKYMTASTTALDGELACATALVATPAGNPGSPSYVRVLLNGVGQSLGNGAKNRACYFSADGGTTARAWSAIVAGDLLYWMGSVAGHQLNTVLDIFDFDYAGNNS